MGSLNFLRRSIFLWAGIVVICLAGYIAVITVHYRAYQNKIQQILTGVTPIAASQMDSYMKNVGKSNGQSYQIATYLGEGFVWSFFKQNGIPVVINHFNLIDYTNGQVDVQDQVEYTLPGSMGLVHVVY